MTRFSLFRVRSPLLTESLLFSLPVGTEMFHFPTFPPHILYIQMQVTTWSCNRWRGSPIRTPSDQSLVINSPRLIADSYVLLRLLMPRHSPCALKNLTTHKLSHLLIERTMKNFLELSRFLYISKKLLLYKDARVHYVVLKQQPHHTPTPTTDNTHKNVCVTP